MKAGGNLHCQAHRRGYSLISALVTTAILAIVGSIAVNTFRGATEAVTGKKLETDIAALNSAVRVYEANGGKIVLEENIAAKDIPKAIIDQLKTKAAAAQHARVVGLRETMADPRLVAVVQSTEEALTGQARAVWNPQKRRFEISHSGGLGIKKLVLDDSIAAAPAGEASRETAVKYADTSSWVWNYVDRDVPASVAPLDYTAEVTPPTFGAPQNANTDQLSSPLFSLPGGTYTLTDFPIALSLTNPNPAGSSNLLYSVDGGDWLQYVGTPINTAPLSTVIAFAATLDPDAWSNSEPVSQNYLVTPVEPQLAFSVPNPTVTYAEIGGTMIGVPPLSPTPGTITLVNTADIPTAYQINSVFTVHWTYDGSDPLSSGTRLDGDPFAGGFPGQDVDYLLGRWDSGATTLPISVAAESQNNAIVTDSQVVSTTLSVNPMPLRAPTVSDVVAGGGTQTVTLSLETGFGDMPAGARIYYTTDGTDPDVDSAGEPVSGTLYQGPFDLNATVTTPITARVYGPDGFAPWFTASPAQTMNPIQPSVAFAMTVSTTAP